MTFKKRFCKISFKSSELLNDLNCSLSRLKYAYDNCLNYCKIHSADNVKI